MNVAAIEHVEEMLSFYRFFGFEIDLTLAPQLYAVKLETQKLNFHDPKLWQNPEFTLRAPKSEPGCGDFCFVWHESCGSLQAQLHDCGIDVELGPVSREGGAGIGTSTYIRDPDGNLIEFITYDEV